MTPPLLQDLPGREAARDLARHELSRRQYEEAKPPWLLRLARYLIDQLDELFGRASAHIPGGGVGLVIVLLLVAGLIGLLVLRIRPGSSRRRTQDELFDDVVRTARGHRERAEAAAAAGEYAEAVRERLRAVVRELESRGVLDARPGRTADEIARDAGTAVPAIAQSLLRGATTFDEVWYGGRTADRAAYDVLVEVDRVVTEARLAHA